ncbi:aldose epimerase family protein [Leptolyngbya sp. NIES-2104]|uniref:aldose epimerase family protein n=1 Tax=Leptolyngbya sp. NIES-2104 TaxID=1552121 RepID=UPI0006EC88E0|nr:aldose epimerase [Leptolyngbya sp. NIES-2104]GAP97158.1 galactose mutarotase and related enzymes [Leptolyngbya sp. NIES-2104]
MFSIERRRQQFDTYVLLDRASNSKLEIVPDRGGMITSWQVQGRELLYMDTARFADPTLSVRGGIPILFPICGNLPNNTYTYKGQTYTLKQHGFARDLPWEVVEQKTDGELSFTIGLSSDDQTLEKYPFQFRLEFTYSLQGQTLVIDQTIENLSDEAMPFSIGFHPYFLALEKHQLRFEIPATEALDQRTQERYPFFNMFDFAQDEIDWAFLETSCQVSHVTDLSRHTRITLTAADEFPLLVFWTVKGKDFYCLEPWSAPRNALNTGDRILSIEPGASLNTTVSFSIEFS